MRPREGLEGGKSGVSVFIIVGGDLPSVSGGNDAQGLVGP